MATRSCPPRPSSATALPEAGQLGALAPEERAWEDIRRGIAVVRALGRVDVGQCAVVQQGLVLGVEAIEGTDALPRVAPGSGGKVRAACW